MRTVCIALNELAEGLGVRAVARIHHVEPDDLRSGKATWVNCAVAFLLLPKEPKSGKLCSATKWKSPDWSDAIGARPSCGDSPARVV